MPTTASIAHLTIEQLQLNLLMAQDNFAAEHRARVDAESLAARIEDELRTLATQLVAPELDLYIREHGRAPDLHRLIEIMRVDGSRRLSGWRALARDPIATTDEPWQQRVQDLQTQLRRAEQTVTDLTQALRNAEQQRDTARRDCQTHIQRIHSLEVDLAQAQADTVPPVTVLDVDSPPADADSELLTRVQPLIQVMAEHGWALWTQVRDELARVSGASNPTLYRWLDDAVQAQLVQVTQATNESGQGGPVRLVELTALGQAQAQTWGYTLVDQQLPALLATHKSAEHTALNLLAAAAFEARGYQVDLFPPVQQVDGSPYDPDLQVVDPQTGEVFCIECERDTRKHSAERNRKWHLVYQGAGAINLVCPTYKSMQRLISEVSSWALTGDYNVPIRATHLRAMTAQSLWAMERT
ncbi:MAG: hypothetical protein KKA73_06810 [Chloroflexi bacterium]|nr:hypothetical protein [Chloroflexota bacterium]MBU1747383.1 hypothetical protein [Chloroflexota bacterium]